MQLQIKYMPQIVSLGNGWLFRISLIFYLNCLNILNILKGSVRVVVAIILTI